MKPRSFTIVAIFVCSFFELSPATASQITGSINFEGGLVTLNSPVGTATAIKAFNGQPIVNNNAGLQPTGSFAGTGGFAVTFAPNGFQFSPTLTNLTNPLWTFSNGSIVYSFNLLTVTPSNGTRPPLILTGTGMLNISGGGYVSTPGTFTLSTVGNGPTILGFTSGAVAESNSPPTSIVVSEPILAGNQVVLNFTVNGGSSGVFQLLQASQVNGAWMTNTTAILSTNVSGSSYLFTTTNGPSSQFYCVQWVP